MEIAVTDAGNPGWMVALGLMLPIFLSGGVIMAGYFGWQLTSKKAWGSFKTPSFGRNFVLIFIMAFFHYAASAAYAYGQSRFELGPVVVYAIFNTTCVRRRGCQRDCHQGVGECIEPGKKDAVRRAGLHGARRGDPYRVAVPEDGRRQDCRGAEPAVSAVQDSVQTLACTPPRQGRTTT